MTTHHIKDNITGQFAPTGTQPLANPNVNTFTAAFGGVSSYSLLHMRTNIELYVVAGGGTGPVDMAFAYETDMIVGTMASVGGSITSSFTPITDLSIPLFTGRLSDWGQWNYLQPTIDFVDTLVPQLVIVTWRPPEGVIDSEFRRRSDTIAGIDVWMPWEIQDGAGLINTTDANGNTYVLGGRFAQQLEWSYRD